MTTIQNKLKSADLSVVPGKGGLMSFPGITAESSRKLSELLQRNQEDHHGFFSDIGFHNHMSDDLLSTYDFGATPADLDAIFNRVKQVQRPPPELHSEIVVDLSDESQWHKYLGDKDRWSDFVTFFQKEMEDIGMPAMLNKRLFAGTEASDDLLGRCFSGLYHPLIRIGCGLEFDIPGLVPIGLATAACETHHTAVFFKKTLEDAKDIDSKEFGKPYLDILNEVQNDPIFRNPGADRQIFHYYSTIFRDAMEPILSYAKQYRVPVDRVDEKTAESLNIAALMFGGAMRKDKEVKVDFFLLHCVTAAIFISAFNAQDWISSESKARLLEWKTRFDILTYVAVGAPVLHADEIKNYEPKVSQDGTGNPWLDIIERSIHVEDDGHTIKAVRALAYGERLAVRYGEELNLPVVGNMWRKIAAMSIDSGEGYSDCNGGYRAWVRGAGFDRSWEVFGPREPRSKLKN
ncbi:hypothetical protein DFP73DRAFT_598482 [Morchella snyderi]|nr:hypothetical protein DFP73DRAFT_598482 [Morchella snyderi]